jgi:hypothetical protein
MKEGLILHRYIVFFVLVMPFMLQAQNYRAIHGSSQAGGLGAANNPSSILHVPFSWDLTLFSVQEAHTTNAFYLADYSLLSHSDSVGIWGYNETSKRFAFTNLDIHLLNARIRLNERQAIAFGANLRSYMYAKTSKFTFMDTATKMRQLMDINRDNIPLKGEMQATAWAEVFATYAQNILDNERVILNAGITVGITRALAGAYLRAGNIGFTQTGSSPPKYILNDATLQYGYSANIDEADAAEKGSKRSAFTRGTMSSMSVSAGLEYIVPVNIAGDESNGYNYDLKIGLSVLDLGFNKYQYSINSRAFELNGKSIADTSLESRFENISSFKDINDTLASLSSSAAVLEGYFHVFQPARVVINVDKNIGGDFFVNGDITIPLTPLLGNKYLAIRDMNLVAVTPRIETKTWGAYLPFTINTRGQAWLGGAVKAVPVLLGLHNWGNVFAKNKMQKGGFYLALTLRPGPKQRQSTRDRMPKISRKQRRQLECPSF